MFISPSENRTVCRRCCTQYSGLVASSSRIHVPVTLETYWISGGLNRTWPTYSRNLAAAVSMRWEWNAQEMASRWQATRSCSSRFCTSSIASVSPDNAHCEGPFTVASDKPLPVSDKASFSFNSTASIAPGGASCMIRPRTATNLSAPSSVNTPARQAATYSPRLCPIIAFGWIPQERHNSASAYSIANSAHCVTRVCFRSSSDFLTSLSAG